MFLRGGGGGCDRYPNAHYVEEEQKKLLRFARRESVPRLIL